MDPESSSRKNQEPKSGVNVVLLLLLVLVVSLISMMVMFNNAPFEIGYKEFQDYLQKKSGAAPTESPSLLIERKSGEQSRVIQISKLRDIVIHDQRIEGKLDWKIENSSNDEAVEKEFVVNIRSEGFGQSIFAEIEKSKEPYTFSAGPTFWEKWGTFIIFSSLILLLFFFMLRRLGGAGSPMQFGRSRGRLYAEEELEVSFDDVAGIDEAVEEVKEIVDFLQSADKYQKLGGRIPKGVLLVGPPGTGKTLLAKAIAGEAGVPFFSLSGSDFVEMFVGVGAARVRDMFQQAVQKAPCIIFIDELDALGKSRGGNIVGGHDEREQTLNALLVEMDGFDSNSGVIVMAATNRPETLDQALLRPGRFDRHVLVDRPDVRGREAILKVHVKNVKLGEDVDLARVACISPGFVGADLANLVNEAALRAAREEKSVVEMNDFDEGVERVTAGLEKKQRVMSEDEKCRVAYHEAGHALVAYSLPNTDPVHKVSIIPRGIAALGYTMQRPEEDRYLMTQAELESRIQVLLAGTMAEEIIYQDISTGAQNDLERATDIARSMVMEYGMSRMGRVNYKDSNRSAFLASGGEESGRTVSEKTQREIDEEVRRFIEESIEKVRNILAVRKESLIALTQRLIEIESVDGDELKEIVDASSPGPLVVPGTDVEQGGPTRFTESSQRIDDQAENA
ncbi:MAG: ATP-dependent zinc metalloprotease FtsH [Planctomycetota bacterium]|nr:ATP-dependent zinc metalloprotease FtsH [Planctomycetota bacterium]